MFRRAIVSLILAMLALTFGCAAPQAMPGDFASQTAQPKTPLAASPDYRLGASDVINVEVRGQPELNRAAVIRPDGKVTLMLVGDVYISGRTAEGVDELLTRMYSEYIIGPDVTVTVVGFNSKEIYMWGEVARVGPQPYTGELTILEALNRAGGFLGRAEPKAVQIARNGKVWKVDIARMVIEGKTDQNVYLQPGDIVFVPLNGFARMGFAMDNIFFPLRSFFSFIFLGDSVNDLKAKHNW
jgi:polysaccharide export outer membrane protein